MTDTTPAVAAVAAALAVPAVPVATAKPSLLYRAVAYVKGIRIKLHSDWEFIITRSWSIRFVFMAFVLSGLEVFMPLFVDTTVVPKIYYASAIAIVTGAAFVARLVAQKREGVSD